MNYTHAQICATTADTLEKIGASADSVAALRRRCNTYRGDVQGIEQPNGDTRWTWTIYENARAVEQGHAWNCDTAEDALAARLASLIPML